MKTPMPDSRATNGSVGFALQILLVLLILATLTGQVFAAVTCPSNMYAVSQTGNAVTATSSGSVTGSTLATGTLSSSGTTASTSNSAKISSGGVLVLDLGTVVPGATSIKLSLARTNSSSRILVSSSLDNASFSTTTTFASASTTNNKLAYITYSIPDGGARYVKLAYSGSAMWVDGVEYSQICQLPPKDYGDAPDTGNGTGAGNYQTKSSDGGPSHSIIPGLMLGSKVDADSGSLQNTAATADDTDGSDDEDGLLSPPIMPTTAGQTYSLTSYVTNTTGSTAYLTAYIDFNRDGDFLDPGEKSDTPQYVYWNGYFMSSFTLPSGLTAGTVNARLRLSQTSEETDSPVGAASSGEVEDYQLTVSAGPYYDFGDAPSTYGSARHTINNSLYLGDNQPDAESNSQYSYNASGDGYDEDSAPKQTGNQDITLFPVLKMTATNYSVNINITNTTGSIATLYGWIDFNQDGVFQTTEAKALNIANNTNGKITLTWDSIPTDIKLGTTFIRLRLTTDSSVKTSTPSGNANDGEVEDFPIAVAMDIPPDSPNVTIVKGDTASSCSSTVFTDDFNDLPIDQYFGQYTSATPYVIRNWTATGGGNDTYASTVTNTAQYPTQGTSIYFGNGFIRRIYPDIGVTPEFDANGRMLSPPDAIELRDNVDDTSPNTTGSGESDWGPEPVKLSRTFATTTGQKYRLYFSAIPEGAGNDTYGSGIMRVDTPSGSIHFKAPGGLEGMQKYRIEFTATSTTSTISFVNYGHIGTDSGWCDPTSIISGAWCSVGGSNISRTGNELIIDDVTVAQASTCLTSNISGKVYVDKNANNIVDTTDTSLGNITVTLYDNNGTTNTTTDDTPTASTSTAVNGMYSFADVSSAMHYRIEVDTRDTDLPVSAIIGTTNPLTDVSVNAGGNLANQNFGFDLACDATLGQFGGIAFRDYNQNGTREPQEEGIAGITVTAYDSTNTSVATATTDARGWYKLSGLSNGLQYRLEYTSLPSGLASGASGMDTASNVRFITAAADCAAHYSISDPVEYCQATPYVATSSFTGGNPALAASGSYTSIHTFPYTAEGEDDTQNVSPSRKATIGQTGALWGMAYQKPTKTLYTSAAMRRFAGLGSLGTGGIYKVDMSNPTANSGASAYVDVRTLGIPTGDDVRTADACNSVANSPSEPAHDVAAWDAVGKIGIGDIDYDETNKRLWLVNLNDRKLYGIKNISPTTAPVAADVLGGYAINLPSPYTCTSGTFRPWAVKYHRGVVYVGGVCDAASDPYTVAKLKGYILKFDPANTAAGFSYVKDFAFDQKRPGYGYNLNSWVGWIPPASAIGWPYFHSPIVGNLEFDSDGSIIVGVIDRAGLQNGNGTYDEPSCTDSSRDYTDAMGDVLRLCKTDSGYIADSEPGCTSNIPTASKVQDEYYWGDMGPDNEAWQSMNEISNGGLALAPGKGQVLISSYDAPNWGSNSVVWLNNTTGAADSKYHVDWSTTGKSAGMGELEVLCDPAPIEVGNRVWLDSDKDGIQNAGEPGINDVTVTLTCGTDSATTTTNTAGEYYFSNKDGGNATFMSTGKSCTLNVLGSQPSVSAYTLTTQNADGKTDNNSQTDIRDSDAANNSGTAVISFTISGSGQNNHSLDFGYQSNVTPGNISGTVYTDSNGNDSYDAGTESGITAITVSLYNENFTPANTADDTLVTTTNTAANGSYSFSSLDTGMTYRVEVDTADSDLPAGLTVGTTNPLTSTLVSAGATTANKNFGFDPASTYTNSYCVTPSGTTGLLDLGNMSTAAINGAGTFSYTNRVLPGYGTVNVSVNMTGGIHSASTTAIDTGTKQQSWLNESLPASGTAIYLEPNSNGSATVTYNFAQPTGNVDLLMLDVDESDSVTITALDASGNAITDFSGWRYRSGDLSVWQNPSPVASAPAWNSTTATLTSTNNINDHRSFGLLTPNTLVTQITVNFSVAAVAGQHVYTILHTTDTGRDGETSCPTNTTKTVSGKVFEDLNYGGGAGRALSTAGTAGVNGARVELYSSAGAFVTSTTTAADGTYTLSNLTNGNYYVRVANATVKSTRSGSNGTALGVQTFRTDGTTATTAEVGGRKPAVADTGSNSTSQTLNTTTFLLSGGGQAQSVQALTVASSNLSGVDFGFNFDTIVNANDSGQGSLRQFILNANLLGGDATLAQTGRTAGKENAILMLAVTDPNYNTTDQYWSIAVQSALPALGDDIILDASTQPNQTGFTFANRPVLELNGTNAGQWNNGLILNGATTGSTVKYLAINRFSGAGIKTSNSKNNLITANHIGTSPLGTAKNIGNTGHGIDVISPTGLSTISNNLIAYNSGNGINAWNFNGVGTTKAAIISGNSIYANIGLGIDLLGTNNINGVTPNDSGDTDTGANELLNFPILSQTTSASGNLTIKGCAPAGATVELFKADVSPGGAASTGANKFGKTQDYGEGQTYLASFVEGSASDTDSANCALAVDADGNNSTGMKAFNVTIPTPAGLVAGDAITTTATLATVGTSEFSPTLTFTSTATKDYGDAPDTYKTTLAADGARHTIMANFYLGATVDGEADGQPSTNADADGSDEDGANFMLKLVPGDEAVIAVGSTQASGSTAKLDAWIDFNGDGDFADAGEQIAAGNLVRSTGSSTLGHADLVINVPETAKAGMTYARFRLSHAGGLGINGAADDGEVEDYQVQIVDGATVGDYVWQDTNKNGVQDTGEPAIKNVLVKLVRVSDGAIVKTVFTDASGQYLFKHVLPGDYQVEFAVPTGYTLTVQSQGSNPAKDSDVDPATGRTAQITVVNGDDQHQWDAGLVLADNKLVYCDTVPYKVTELNESLVLPKFDTKQGTLTGVDVTAYSATKQFLAAENFAAQTQTMKLVSDVLGLLTLPNSSSMDTTYSDNSGSFSLTGADGILDFRGTSARAFSEWRYGVKTATTSYATPNDFKGAATGDNVTLPYETLSGLTVTGGGGNNVTLQLTRAAVAACVTYTYEYEKASLSISGKVFEDKDYGGGAGRPLSATGMAGIMGVQVELYDATGSFVTSTTTTNGGPYTFSNLAGGTYYVRVVNDTIRSSRAGSNATERSIQTFRTDGTTHVTNEVGGRKPALVDASANTTSQTLNTTTFLLSGGGQAQSVQPITLASSDISGANFGFNFSTVVNTNDSGQGSLRQGILNINMLANTGLAQAGQDNTYGVNSSVTKEVLLFNIPATSDPLGRADICGGTNCKITVSTQLPSVSKQPAIIDATTQPGYVAGTPGVPRIQIVPAAGLDATGFTMDYDAPDSTFRGFAITGFKTKTTNRGLTINSERTLVESNYIGVTPAGVADGNGHGVELQWTQSAILGGTTAAKRNIISGNKGLGIFFNTGASGGTIQNNYIGTNPAGTAAMGNGTTGLDTESGSDTKILDNIIAGNVGNGIELGSTGGSYGLANGIIQGNRIGVGVNGEALGNGTGIMNYGASSGHTIGGTSAGQGNIIAYNQTGGIMMYNNNSSNVVISGNSIYANGNLGIDLGNNGVTVNDANDVDAGANNLLNFPILSQLTLAGGNLTIKGCAPAGATVELFEADVSTGGKATVGDNKQGKSKDYGEGQTYLASFVEGSASDADSDNCTLVTDADGNNQTGMSAFSVTIPTPTGFVTGDVMTATATVATVGTSEFSPTQTLLEIRDITGKVFEDVNYGGDAGRAFGAVGSAGVSGVQLELYNASNALVASTTSTSGGAYTFASIPTGAYQVKVISNTVKSTRPGSNGTELGVMTYRTDGVTPTTTVGGAATQTLTLANTNLSGVDFGFNFDTVTNTNDSGAGSLRQFLLNANLLGGDTTLAQTGRVSGKENAILMLPTTDPNYNTAGTYWSIPLQSALPALTSPLVLDGSLPAGSNTNPALELKGTTAGAGSNGLTLNAGADGSTIRKLAINGFGGAGIYLNGSNNNSLQSNKLGATPTGTARANTGAGILLNASSNNLIGGTASGTGNLLANNAGDGIAITGATSLANSILGNSIYNNTGLGIDLGDNGVTANDVGDTDTGANDLLNFPEVKTSSFGANGTKIITYDFDLDAPAGDYRLEFFASTNKDPSDHGEGEVFIGSKDISLETGSANFKGTLNANMTVLKGTFISTTLTQKTDASSFGATSEFSGIREGITTQVCDSLVSGSGSDMVIDETNPTTIIKLLEAFDYSSTPAVPITYVISGGADGNLFTIENPTSASTLPCATVKFISNDVVITKAASADVDTRAGQFPTPGNYELPMDSGKDNIYDLQITGTTATGKKYVRDMSVRVMNTNEAPIITSAAAASFMEDTNGDVLTVKAQDTDAGDKLTYSISGGADAKQFEMAATTGILRFKAVPDYDAPMDTNRDNRYEVEVTATDTGGLSNSKLFSISVTNNTADDGVLLNVRALLQGAYNSTTALLSDDLHRLGLLPSKQPYSAAPFNYAGAETLGTLPQETTGNNAVVDWVLVELRSSLSTVVARRAVILQRNGSLVDSQTGSATLHFTKVASGNYYVSVRHRNHLGVITASPVSLNHTERLVDFTVSTTATQGEESRFMSGKLALMWAGDINANNTLTANGPGNDVTSLLSGVISSTDNVQGNTNHILSGYLATDLTMDGKTLFTGPGNDTSLLVGNIILHPLNTGFAANYIVRGGL